MTYVIGWSSGYIYTGHGKCSAEWCRMLLYARLKVVPKCSCNINSSRPTSFNVPFIQVLNTAFSNFQLCSLNMRCTDWITEILTGLLHGVGNNNNNKKKISVAL